MRVDEPAAESESLAGQPKRGRPNPARATGIVLALGLVVATVLIIANLEPGTEGAHIAECSGQVIAFVAAGSPAIQDAIARDAGRVTAFAPITIRVTGDSADVQLTDAGRGGPGPIRDAGARAIAVITNGTGQGPDPVAVQAVLSNLSVRSQVLTNISQNAHAWDSIVLDFEKINPDERQKYVQFVRDLKVAVAKPLAVAVPAFTADPENQAYDIAALAQVADQIIWMAYDQHYAASGPGPVAGYGWVQQGVNLALTRVPPDRLVLGVPTYGYQWESSGAGKDISFNEGEQLARIPFATVEYDTVQREKHVRLPDGTQAWYSNADSARARAQIAIDMKLCGVALWRAGLEDPTTLGSLPSSTTDH